MKNFILILLGLAILIGGGYLTYTKLITGNLLQRGEITNIQRTSLEASQNVIEIKNYTFAPKTLTIKVGETVTWINRDGMSHDATADDGSWKTELMFTGESQTKKFDKKGTYTYHCSQHPWMKATIIVQ